MIIAPTEPDKLKAIASSISLLPEKYGADIFFIGQGGRKVGIQRKEIKDLLASVNDGRLVKEILQMGALDYKIVLVEGREQYSTDGYLLNSTFGKQWNAQQFNGLLWSIQDRVDFLVKTESLPDTVAKVGWLRNWFSKSSHESLSRRPGMAKGVFGDSANSKEAASWILQSVPSVGPKLATRIVEKFGLPLRLTVGVEDLMKVEGIGKGKAEGIVRMFQEMNE